MPLRRAALAIGLCLFLGACGSSETDEVDTSVTDDLERTVELDRPIERVISLAPNLTELTYAAAGGSTLVAVTSSADYPPAVDSIDHVSALPVDFEAVTSKNPDLVLATDQINPPGDSETFDALDVPIYFFSFSSVEDVFGALRTMGTLLGTEATARDSAAVLERQLATLRARTDSFSTSERPRVLVLIGDDTLYSFGAGSYVHEIVDAAGGRSITASLETEAPTLSEEFVLTEKPDVIIGAWGTGYDPNRLLNLHPTWDVVPAIENGRVYSLPSSLLLRPGPRLVTGARRMAAHLHPERFEDHASSSEHSEASTSSSSENGTPEP